MAQTRRSNPAIGGAVPTQCDPEPSAEDAAVTRELVGAGKLLDIALLDHVVIGRQGVVSLKERGVIPG